MIPPAMKPPLFLLVALALSACRKAPPPAEARSSPPPAAIDQTRSWQDFLKTLKSDYDRREEDRKASAVEEEAPETEAIYEGKSPSFEDFMNPEGSSRLEFAAVVRRASPGEDFQLESLLLGKLPSDFARFTIGYPEATRLLIGRTMERGVPGLPMDRFPGRANSRPSFAWEIQGESFAYGWQLGKRETLEGFVAKARRN